MNKMENRIWDNKVTSNGCTHYSQFIASWLRACNGKDYYRDLREWVRSLDGLSEMDKRRILFLASNADPELVTNAQQFIMNKEFTIEES